MRILHSGDWHLGATLGNQSRTDDQFDRIAEIVDYIERERVDLLLVAGDVFEDRTMTGLATITERLASALRRPLDLGVTIVFVAGNHDRAVVFALLQSLQLLVAPQHASQVHFADAPQVLPLELRGGVAVDVVALPYPYVDRYGLDPSAIGSTDAKHRALADAVQRAVRDLASRTRRGVPRVLVGHLLLAGVRGGRCEREDEEIPIDPSFPTGFAYVGLGHIHKPEALDDAGTMRYAGSLERMDGGETTDTKSVVLVEIETGTVRTRTLPLHPRPITRITARSRGELEERREELADPDGTLVFAHLQVRRDDSLRELLADARALFPRLYDHEVDRVDEPVEPRPSATFIRSVPEETCRAYLDEVLQDDPDRDSLRALLELVLAPAGSGRT